MNSFLLHKRKAMKTAALVLSPDIFRRCITLAIGAGMAAALLTTTAAAQGRHGGFERGGGERGGGGNFGRSRTEQNRVPSADSRRWGSSSERGMPGRDNNPGRTNINRDFGRNNDIVRGDGNSGFNRNNGQGNVRDINRNNDIVRNDNRDFNRTENRFPSRDRMELPGNRTIDRNNNLDRRMTPGRLNERGFSNRPSYRPVVGTYNRPAYRPTYRYDFHPVYDRYNPAWRYGFLPRRNCYFYSLPSTYINISFGGIGYRYWDGVFYRPYNNLFTVIAPPVGIFINVLPVGYRTIYVRDYPYYYYNGTYYDRKNNNYYVVSPPVGAVVESLPAGYETVVIDGETFYTADGAQYKPVIQQNGEIWYEVIKAN